MRSYKCGTFQQEILINIPTMTGNTDHDVQKLYYKVLKKNEYLENDIASLKMQLEEVEKERAEYLQNVAHQLSAPLHAIKGHIENITNVRVGVHRGREILSSIYAQSTIAVYMVKNFAFMSALSSDSRLTKYLEEKELIDVKRTLVNLVNDFRPLAKNYKVDFIIDDQNLDKLPKIYVIKNLMRQALSNFLDNAAKYSNEDSEIRISGENLKGKKVSINISNQGIPITSKEIFDRGFRSQEAINKIPAGTGYGLYITAKIIDIHKGKIKVEIDQQRKINTFKVILPIQ